MAKPNKIRVTGCSDCPFTVIDGDSHPHRCNEPSAAVPPWLTVDQVQFASEPPPEWCPLRSSFTKVILVRR